jgi:hypothetical protein
MMSRTRFAEILLPSALLLLAALATGCGSSSDTTTVSSSISGPNVLEVTVDGSQCDPSDYYVNEPCTSVTICSPSTGACQTISNILVDTGSFGLRIFSSAISVPLDQVTDGSGKSIAECATFGSATTWGPVQKANLSLASEGSIEVPIQVIDSSYATSVNCGSPETAPSSAGFNGILGVGLLQYDCGDTCADYASNDMYYSCTGSSCNGGTAVQE